MVFQWCFKKVSRGFQESSKDVSRKNLGYIDRVLSVFSRVFKRTSRLFQGCFKGVSRKFQESLKGVLNVSIMFQGSFKIPSRKF